LVVKGQDKGKIKDKGKTQFKGKVKFGKVYEVAETSEVPREPRRGASLDDRGAEPVVDQCVDEHFDCIRLGHGCCVARLASAVD
jgi:hypothetical protein